MLHEILHQMRFVQFVYNTSAVFLGLTVLIFDPQSQQLKSQEAFRQDRVHCSIYNFRKV